jgi:hypothetical protein
MPFFIVWPWIAIVAVATLLVAIGLAGRRRNHSAI